MVETAMQKCPVGGLGREDPFCKGLDPSIAAVQAKIRQGLQLPKAVFGIVSALLWLGPGT